MAGITLEIAEQRLADYLAAEEAVLGNQSYAIGDRSLTRANLAEIRKGIEIWDQRVKKLSANAGGGRVRYVVPE